MTNTKFTTFDQLLKEFDAVNYVFPEYSKLEDGSLRVYLKVEFKWFSVGDTRVKRGYSEFTGVSTEDVVQQAFNYLDSFENESTVLYTNS